jgi:hypothetical protein
VLFVVQQPLTTQTRVAQFGDAQLLSAIMMGTQTKSKKSRTINNGSGQRYI